MAVPKKNIDWERIEYDFRSGVLSLREIAAKSGVSHVAITKRAKKDGWTRDLSKRIAARAEALVNAKEVNRLVNNTERALTEKAQIEVRAAAIADVRTEQMIAATRTRRQVELMLEELAYQSCKKEDLRDIGEMIREANELNATDGLKRAYDKVLSFSGRVSNMKSLVESYYKACELERRVYGIENLPPEENTHDRIIIEHIRPEPRMPDPDGRP